MRVNFRLNSRTRNHSFGFGFAPYARFISRHITQLLNSHALLLTPSPPSGSFFKSLKHSGAVVSYLLDEGLSVWRLTSVAQTDSPCCTSGLTHTQALTMRLSDHNYEIPPLIADAQAISLRLRPESSLPLQAQFLSPTIVWVLHFGTEPTIEWYKLDCVLTVDLVLDVHWLVQFWATTATATFLSGSHS